MLNRPFYSRVIRSALCFAALQLPVVSSAQVPRDTLPSKVTLDDCISYALINQPALRQSILDEDITRQDIRIALSGWLPQINATANLQHNPKLPVVFFPNSSDPSGPKQQVTTGVSNTSALHFSANQAIYSTDLLFAGKSANDLRRLSSENTQSSKIDLVVNVSKAFYDVLLSQQQLLVLDEDILRLDKNLKDSYNLYKNGLTEKTDYQRTTISLNNAIAQRRTTQEAVKVKYAYLKQLMGAPGNSSFTLSFDSASVAREIVLDTLQNINYNSRPEYRALKTTLVLQQLKTSYYKWDFLPEFSAFAGYNLNYQNDEFSQLYNQNYPNSFLGLKLTVPIFQGTARLQNIRKADLQTNRVQLDITNLENEMNTEYSQALADYKSNMNELRFARQNIGIAKEIFNTVKLQYDEGVVMYLEVILAEADLRTAQLNYLSVLDRVLSSTLDVKKALGTIVVK
jgi:outer membrane protein